MIRILLPAWNESGAIPILVDKFKQTMKEPYQITVYDDGSSDSTFDTARKLTGTHPIECLRHQVNQGLGPTLNDGLRHLADISSDDDLIVTLDCDDTHEPKYLPAAVDMLRSQKLDVVILSRYVKGSGQSGLSFMKTVTSMGAGIFLKLFFPIKGVMEYSCNYRVIRAGKLKEAINRFGTDFIALPHLGFVAAPEILIKLHMIQAKIGESPFVLRYDQKQTPSANQSLRTIRGYFALAAKYAFRRPKL